MSRTYKILDFNQKHKVGVVPPASWGGPDRVSKQKFASAVKIGNTNQIGWREDTTPSSMHKLHTYLPFRDWIPANKKTRCVATASDWDLFSYGDMYRYGKPVEKKGNLPGDSLRTTFRPSLTNIQGYGKVFKAPAQPSSQRYSQTYLNYNFSHRCAIEKRNLPHTGGKYTLTFWFKYYTPSSLDHQPDRFVYYQSNDRNLFKFSSKDNSRIDLWRLLNMVTSNYFVIDAKPLRSSGNDTVDVTFTQYFWDYAIAGFDVKNYGGVRVKLPIDQWTFVSVIIDEDQMKVVLNPVIHKSRTFQYEDILSGNQKINNRLYSKDAMKKSYADRKKIDGGRNYNFSDVSDEDRIHGMCLYNKHIHISDFRVYSDLAPESPLDRFLCHVQNHRNQVGDLPSGDVNDSVASGISDVYGDLNFISQNNNELGGGSIPNALPEELEIFYQANVSREEKIKSLKELSIKLDVNVTDLYDLITKA